MPSPIENTVEQYTREICSLLPLHRLAIFFLCIILSNYILYETPFAIWPEGENVIPEVKSFWSYLSNKTLYDYFSLNDGILLHGKLKVYLVAIAFCSIIYIANIAISKYSVALLEKIFRLDIIVEKIAKKAQSIRFTNATCMLIYISDLMLKKSTIETSLKYLNFYTEILLCLVLISILSIFSSGTLFLPDLITLGTTTIMYLLLKVFYLYKFLKQYKPTAIFIDTLRLTKSM